MSQLQKTVIVVSNKMKKTVMVQVTRRVKHYKFGKYFQRYQKFQAHDEKNECQVGDKVLVKACRPLSCHKRWIVEKIIEKGEIMKEEVL